MCKVIISKIKCLYACIVVVIAFKRLYTSIYIKHLYAHDSVLCHGTPCCTQSKSTWGLRCSQGIIHWTLQVERYVCFIDKRRFFNEKTSKTSMLNGSKPWPYRHKYVTSDSLSSQKQWQFITNSRLNQTSSDLYIYVQNNAILCLNLINTHITKWQ